MEISWIGCIYGIHTARTQAMTVCCSVPCDILALLMLASTFFPLLFLSLFSFSFSGLILPPTGSSYYYFIFFYLFNVILIFYFTAQSAAVECSFQYAVLSLTRFHVLTQGSAAAECAAHVHSVFPVSHSVRTEHSEPSVVTSHAM